MTRPPGFSWPRISTGLEILPPTLMVALGHPWLGAAVLGAVLASSALQSRMWVRSEQERHRALLSFAQDSTSMGGDPTTVIAALQRRVAAMAEFTSALPASAAPRPVRVQRPAPTRSRCG